MVLKNSKREFKTSSKTTKQQILFRSLLLNLDGCEIVSHDEIDADGGAEYKKVLDVSVCARRNPRSIWVTSRPPKVAGLSSDDRRAQPVTDGHHPADNLDADSGPIADDLAPFVTALLTDIEADRISELLAALVDAAAKHRGATQRDLVMVLRAIGDTQSPTDHHARAFSIVKGAAAIAFKTGTHVGEDPTIWCIAPDRVRRNIVKGFPLSTAPHASFFAVLDGTADRMSPHGLAIDRILVRFGSGQAAWIALPFRGQPLLPIMPGIATTNRGLFGYVWRSLRMLAKPAALSPILRELAAVTTRASAPLTLRTPPLHLTLHCAVPTSHGSVFISGTLCDPLGIVKSLTVRAPCGTAAPLAPLQWVTTPPPIGDRPTAPAPFVALAQGLPREADDTPVQYQVDVLTHGGGRRTVFAPATPLDMVDRRSAVLKAVGETPSLSEGLIERCLAPVLQSLQTSIRLARGKPREIVDFGALPEAPRRSLVIPLYKRLDFLKFQLAWFASDPDLEDTEIILVLDSPEDDHRLRQTLQGLAAVYGIPVRLAVMTRNGGYAAAVNSGVDLARGETLVLLNSDVIPTAPRWMSALDDAAALVDRPGLVGPRLVFDDGSLQHAGLYFEKHTDGTWLNRHHWKGYPGPFAPAHRRRRVPALTGACVRITRDTFHEVGGFTEDYVIADYEDSDLSLKLHVAGYEHVYAGDVCLLHFERASVAKHEDYVRTHADAYNRWLHHQTWDTTIGIIMATESSMREQESDRMEPIR